MAEMSRFNSDHSSDAVSSKGEDAANIRRNQTLLKLTRELYAMPRGGVGCCLHIVLDDHNWTKFNVAYCRARAIEKRHDNCIQIASLLLEMSKTQRLKFLGMKFWA